MRWPLFVAWTCAALAAGALAAALALRGIDPDPAESALWLPIVAVVAVPALAAGVAIARGRPRNPVGAILAGLGLITVVDAMLATWADAAVHGEVAGGAWAVALYQADWAPVFGILALLLLLFPDGHPPSARWRPVVWLATGAPLVLFAVALIRDEAFDDPYAGVDPPLGIVSGATSSVLSGVTLLALIAALVLAAVAMILRFRRSRGVERTQMKWLAAAAVLLPIAIVAGTIDGFLNDQPGLLTLLPFAAVYVGFVAAVVVAMLRHGLYDVDRVISRTIAWVALTLVLAAAAVGLALLVAEPLGGGSTAGAAVAAVAATLAFDPLRRRIQRAVDRRFDRDRSRAVERLEAFAALLHDGAAAPEDVEGVLREVLGDPGLRLLVWLPDPGTYASLDGIAVPDPTPGPGRSATAVGRGDVPLGLVMHSQRLDARPGLVADVLRAAALPVEVARLRGELRGRLEEVEESRARIVRAGYEERRRLERDLHDGAQQRLVALGMALRRLQRRPGADPELVQGLDGAVGELGDAVRDLREIARGLRPGALDDGLGPALSELARRSPLPVGVEGPPDGLPPEIETAAYYVVLEAVTNAVKHADATRVEVCAERRNGSLVVTVADDGCGGAAATASGGLAGLADRVAAHGGAMTVESPPGSGTRVEVVLPCGS